MSDETNITVSDESGVTSMETLLSETGNGDLDLSGTNGTPYDPELDDPIIGLEYLATFADLKDYEDTLEERTSSVCSGVHYSTKRERETWIAKGYQPITVEEQNALVDGGVRRKSDGAIVPRPPVIIPLQSRIDSLISQINNYTAEQITGGFVSEVTSGPNPGTAKFDSTTNDQNARLFLRKRLSRFKVSCVRRIFMGKYYLSSFDIKSSNSPKSMGLAICPFTPAS